ncbi:putative replication factor C subunit 3 [Apostichopus japonicus]|uniref:Putative replication factor C subunit 3 n=1 Tax=Stichopus japonicus TaxID=307972 RepID=A0A2G8JMG4_STIJA|nr:putative replication factor C subunit 3 [Apostichopus japonicus]
MSFWVDKHRPKLLGKLDYHKEQAAKLKKLVSTGDFPHLLVYGPSGAGKKTRIMCILKELYGPGVERLRIEHQTFTTPSKRKVEISTVASNFHIEVNPSDAGIYDRIVIQELIKTTASTQQLETGSMKDFKGPPPFHREALNIVHKKIVQILQSTCKKENLTLPPELAKNIAVKSNRNLRKALLMCEACKVQQYPFSHDQSVPDADWEVFLRATANQIVQQQSPKQLLVGLLEELLKSCDGALKSEMSQIAAFYEHRMQQGNKAIYHLEAFVAKFMSIYNDTWEGFEDGSLIATLARGFSIDLPAKGTDTQQKKPL